MIVAGSVADYVSEFGPELAVTSVNERFSYCLFFRFIQWQEAYPPCDFADKLSFHTASVLH